jgi:thioredoxin reductase (NADPH)
VAVLGHGNQGSQEAEFLIKSGFSQVTLLSFRSRLRLSKKQRQALSFAGVNVVPEPVLQLKTRGREILAFTDKSELRFETVYGSLGLNARCELAQRVGARSDKTGALVVDRHYETSVPGLFAAGDVVAGLSQVVVAMGHAAIAATAIHNRLGVPPRRSIQPSR